MQITAIILSFLTATASAAPSGKSCPANPPIRKFGIQAVRPNTAVHYGLVSAWNSQLYIQLPAEKFNAQCEGGDRPVAATFYIKDGGLYLHGFADKVQQFRVNPPRASQVQFGKTNLDFFTHDQESTTPIQGALDGWALNEQNVITWNGKALSACPTPNGDSYAIWAHMGEGEPTDGDFSCLVFIGRTLSHGEDAQKCFYPQDASGGLRM